MNRMSPKKKNPYAMNGGAAGAAPAEPKRTAAAAASAAPVVAPVAPVAPVATPVVPVTPVAAPVVPVAAPVAAEVLKPIIEFVNRVDAGLLQMQQQTGVSAEALAVLRKYPAIGGEVETAEGLQILLKAGLATAAGLTSRGQLLKQKVMKIA